MESIYDPGEMHSLRCKLDTQICAALKEEGVVEIMLNCDGKLWVEKHGEGMKCIGEMEAMQADAIIRMVASLLGTTVTKENPKVEGPLPLDGLPEGTRFQGMAYSAVKNPSFAIRLPAAKIFTLDDYVSAGIMTPEVRAFIATVILERKNLLIVGGTGSGKTTLANSILLELANLCPNDRLVIIQDMPELKCRHQNRQFLNSSEDSEKTSMQNNLQTTLRLRPDRIIVGEVRGPVALDLIMAWGTGHPGGLCTIHAANTYEAMGRLELLISLNKQGIQVTNILRSFISIAVNVIIVIQRDPDSSVRSITEVAELVKFDSQSETYQFNYHYRRNQ